MKNKNSLAWALLVCAEAIHVADEAAHGFLSFYNPFVRDMRESLGFWPMPTFSTEVWLIGLILAIIISFLLIPIVVRGGRFIRVVVIAIGIIMVLNSLAHMFGSVYFGYLLPGFWSSPLLLAASIFVVVRGFRRAGWVSS
ncbi:MAG: hypothetical protein JSV52_02355 [Candidatus Zixiibacteriota bacterium]|nr:MAG: hypothetical protein JSV52_02355 [candidate division Zixibacteria bacterium]